MGFSLEKISLVSPCLRLYNKCLLQNLLYETTFFLEKNSIDPIFEPIIMVVLKKNSLMEILWSSMTKANLNYYLSHGLLRVIDTSLVMLRICLIFILCEKHTKKTLAVYLESKTLCLLTFWKKVVIIYVQDYLQRPEGPQERSKTQRGRQRESGRPQKVTVIVEHV